MQCPTAPLNNWGLLLFQVTTSDFREFDYIFGMDTYNISLLSDLAPSDATARVELLGKYDPECPRIIWDPYFVSYVGTLSFQDGMCHSFIKLRRAHSISVKGRVPPF